MNRDGEDFYYMTTLIEVHGDDLETMEQLAGGAQFVALQRAEKKDLHPLLAVAQGHQLHKKTFPRPAHPHDT